MTIYDTTYFLSEPKQFKNADDKTRWENTFKFLENTINKKRRTYSHEEVTNQLEKSTPLIKT